MRTRWNVAPSPGDLQPLPPHPVPLLALRGRDDRSVGVPGRARRNESGIVGVVRDARALPGRAQRTGGGYPPGHDLDSPVVPADAPPPVPGRRMAAPATTASWAPLLDHARGADRAASPHRCRRPRLLGAVVVAGLPAARRRARGMDGDPVARITLATGPPCSSCSPFGGPLAALGALLLGIFW